MNHFVKRNFLSPGDVVVCPKSFLNIIEHYAIYLGQTSEGIDLFSENNNEAGVRLITATDLFKENHKIIRIKKFKGTVQERREAVHSALSDLGKPYSLINYNCEHYANKVQFGTPYSSQVKWGIFSGLVACLIIFIATSD